ncbi:MAG: DegV family protein [Oscillospiraceae bacterium]|nr:DegV family protein [Oscillospiraceae bacterium]
MIRIIADTACDLTPREAEQLQVQLVPLGLIFEDGTACRDRLDLAPEEFYKKLMDCKELPTTSQPSFSAWTDLFEEAAAAGDQVVAVLVSSRLSGTYQSALAAAQLLDAHHVYLVDSLAAALSQNLLVRLAAQLRDEGCSAAEIARVLEEKKHALRLVALIDDLKYLHKGGRLPATVAVAGNLLGIKPVISLREGKVKLAGKGRGLPGAYVALFKLLESEGGLDETMPVMPGYTFSPKGAEPIFRHLENNLRLKTDALCHVGPAIGTHVGPYCAGLAFFAKEYTVPAKTE